MCEYANEEIGFSHFQVLVSSHLAEPFIFLSSLPTGPAAFLEEVPAG
jgi:hypothetical protein